MNSILPIFTLPPLKMIFWIIVCVISHITHTASKPLPAISPCQVICTEKNNIGDSDRCLWDCRNEAAFSRKKRKKREIGFKGTISGPLSGLGKPKWNIGATSENQNHDTFVGLTGNFEEPPEFNIEHNMIHDNGDTHISLTGDTFFNKLELDFGHTNGDISVDIEFTEDRREGMSVDVSGMKRGEKSNTEVFLQNSPSRGFTIGAEYTKVSDGDKNTFMVSKTTGEPIDWRISKEHLIGGKRHMYALGGMGDYLDWEASHLWVHPDGDSKAAISGDLTGVHTVGYERKTGDRKDSLQLNVADQSWQLKRQNGNSEDITVEGVKLALEELTYGRTFFTSEGGTNASFSLTRDGGYWYIGREGDDHNLNLAGNLGSVESFELSLSEEKERSETDFNIMVDTHGFDWEIGHHYTDNTNTEKELVFYGDTENDPVLFVEEKKDGKVETVELDLGAASSMPSNEDTDFNQLPWADSRPLGSRKESTIRDPYPLPFDIHVPLNEKRFYNIKNEEADVPVMKNLPSSIGVELSKNRNEKQGLRSPIEMELIKNSGANDHVENKESNPIQALPLFGLDFNENIPLANHQATVMRNLPNLIRDMISPFGSDINRNS